MFKMTIGRAYKFWNSWCEGGGWRTTREKRRGPEKLQEEKEKKAPIIKELRTEVPIGPRGQRNWGAASGEDAYRRTGCDGTRGEDRQGAWRVRRGKKRLRKTEVEALLREERQLLEREESGFGADKAPRKTPRIRKAEKEAKRAED